MANYSVTYDLTSGSNIKTLKTNLLTIARSYCPVDTGNMKYSAIYVIDTIRGFKIVWDLDRAHYIKYVNEGTQPMSPRKELNKDFVDRSLVAICGYVDYYQRKNGNVEKMLVTENGKYKFSNVYGLYGYINQNIKRTNENYETLDWIKKLGLTKNDMLKSLTDVLLEKTGAKETTPSLVSNVEQNKDYSKYSTPSAKRLVKKTYSEMLKSLGFYRYIDYKEDVGE